MVRMPHVGEKESYRQTRFNQHIFPTQINEQPRKMSQLCLQSHSVLTTCFPMNLLCLIPWSQALLFSSPYWPFHLCLCPPIGLPPNSDFGSCDIQGLWIMGGKLRVPCPLLHPQWEELICTGQSQEHWWSHRAKLSKEVQVECTRVWSLLSSPTCKGRHRTTPRHPSLPSTLHLSLCFYETQPNKTQTISS